MVWKDRVLRLLHTPKIYTETTQGSDMQRGQQSLHASEMELHFTVINEQCPMACGKVSFTAE